MRLRKKKYARPSLEACDFFVAAPAENMGKWHTVFKKRQNIWLELGCGKGGFISRLASSKPELNFMAVDIKDEMLILAKEKIEKEYGALNSAPNNIKLMSHEIMLIGKMLDEHDIVERIFINFCNPWYKNRHRTRRLTHPNQLNQYKSFLAKDGQIWFKTDDTPLFKDSVGYFETCGFKLVYITEDLHNSSFDKNIVTEHEKFLLGRGFKINFLIAER